MSAEESEVLLDINAKVSECIVAAGKVRLDEQALVEKLWHHSLKCMQNIWSKGKLCQSYAQNYQGDDSPHAYAEATSSTDLLSGSSADALDSSHLATYCPSLGKHSVNDKYDSENHTKKQRNCGKAKRRRRRKPKSISSGFLNKGETQQESQRCSSKKNGTELPLKSGDATSPYNYQRDDAHSLWSSDSLLMPVVQKSRRGAGANASGCSVKEEPAFECHECKKTFTSRGNLQRHLLIHMGEVLWLCSVCGKRFTEKKSLKVHMRIHTGEKPFVCHVCYKRFSQSSILKSHLLVHSGRLDHMCDICGRSFRQRSQLKTHHLRHAGIRPFSCPEKGCISRFTTKGDMERHQRTHSQEKPYQCNICSSSYARQETLHEHTNRHLGVKPVECRLCSKKFYDSASASYHVKRVHQVECDKDVPASLYLSRSDGKSEQVSRIQHKTWRLEKDGRVEAHKTKTAICKGPQNCHSATEMEIYLVNGIVSEETEQITITANVTGIDSCGSEAQDDGNSSNYQIGGCLSESVKMNFENSLRGSDRPKTRLEQGAGTVLAVLGSLES